MTVIAEDMAKEALRQRLGQGARYDAASAPARELAWARRGTAYFARKLNELTDAELDEPALLPGQLRRHIVAMVGYEARELALAVETARTGIAPQEASPEDWREQAQMGATLPARALRNLFDHAEVHLNVEWRDLADADWQKVVTLDDGRAVPMVQTPWLRARSIWIRAVDLGNGGSFLDFPPDLLDTLLAEIATKPMPPLRLSPTDRAQPIALGTGQGIEVSGTAADLARWLTGRGARRLNTPAGPLPDLPSGHEPHHLSADTRHLFQTSGPIMTATLFPVPAWPTATVRGVEAEFPVNRIFCVGRNYAEHAKEMGVEVDREAPFYFLKTHLALIASGATIPYPPGTANYHYEMEFVVAIGAPAFKIAKADAESVVYGYATGLDMTRRDLQLESRAKQRPWDFGKDFEQSAVLSEIIRKEEFGAIGSQRIQLSVNGTTKQDSSLSELVWSVPELISHLSNFYHLVPGDLIYTGTPAGVGPVLAGDKIHGAVDGLPAVELTLSAAE